MKIIVGLGGAPKNPSHGDIAVTVAHRLRSGHCLDNTDLDLASTRLCNAYTAPSQDLAIPSHDLTIRYHSFIAPRRTFTRPETRGTLPYLDTILPHLAKLSYAVTDLYYATTSPNCTKPSPLSEPDFTRRRITLA